MTNFYRRSFPRRAAFTRQKLNEGVIANIVSL